MIGKLTIGSNDELKAQVKLKGKDNYKRTILKLCYTKYESTWFELEEQIKRNVLTDDTYYNDNVLGKFFKTKVKGFYNSVKK